MNNKPTNKRYSLTNFTRFVSIIDAALAVYPDALAVDPRPLMASSFKQPCRDALTAYTQGHVKYPLWQGKPVESLIVSEDAHGQIWLGPIEGIRARRPVQTASFGSPLSTQPERDIEYRVLSTELDALCAIMNRGAFQPTPCFVIHGLREDEVPRLESLYPNVAFVPIEGSPGKYQLL